MDRHAGLFGTVTDINYSDDAVRRHDETRGPVRGQGPNRLIPGIWANPNGPFVKEKQNPLIYPARMD